MKDFLMREKIEEKDGIKVTRSRTDYERRARLLVDALDAIRADPCNLPEVD